MTKLPLVAIVGRPNVGKSTLFNSLLGKRKNLVLDEPGVTRDLHFEEVFLEKRRILLVDTGGLVEEVKNLSDIQKGIQKHVFSILEEADRVIFLFDGKEGLVSDDYELVSQIRKKGKNVIYVVNKIDSTKHQDLPYGFYELGVEILAISAEHKLGLETLKRKIVEQLPEKEQIEESSKSEKLEIQNQIKLAIIGRPNVGKSTLLNQLLGKERALVSNLPGTTRDGVESTLVFKDIEYQIIDTAGVRKKGKTKGLEGLSVIKTLRAIEKAHLVVLVLDLSQGIREQDCKIASLAHQRGRGVLIFGNKVDLLPNKKESKIKKEIYARMPFMAYAPILLGSAKNGIPQSRFFSFLYQIERGRHLYIPTAELNKMMTQALRERPLPVRSGKPLKLHYLTQAVAQGEKRGLRPATPSFICFVNEPKSVHYSDQRYLLNCIRKHYGFLGNPIFLEFREKSNPE